MSFGNDGARTQHYTSCMRRFLFALLACLACSSVPGQAPVRVLFVGNELLGAGDIAGRVAKVASATGRSAVIDSLTAEGYTLDDQADDPKVRESLRRGWDIVVMQGDAPSADHRGRFIAGVKRFAQAVRDAHARPALFMAWPRGDRLQSFRDTLAAHRDAAQATDALLIPAGEAWLRALGENRRLRLYAGEGATAAPLGNDLAAMTAYFALFPAGAQEFDEAYIGKIAKALGTPPATRDLLIDAATRAIDEPLALGKKASP